MELLVCAGLLSTVGASVLMASTIGEGIDGGAKHPTSLDRREVRLSSHPPSCSLPDDIVAFRKVARGG